MSNDVEYIKIREVWLPGYIDPSITITTNERGWTVWGIDKSKLPKSGAHCQKFKVDKELLD